MLPQRMIDLGYKTSFYYGGDLNFGNMNTYLRNAGITNIVDGSEFDKKDWNSKWGAHDHVLIERFTNDLKNKQTSNKNLIEFIQDYSDSNQWLRSLEAPLTNSILAKLVKLTLGPGQWSGLIMAQMEIHIFCQNLTQISGHRDF